MRFLGSSGGSVSSTADVPDSADRRYVTDAQRTVIAATSGVNTGDQTSVANVNGTGASDVCVKVGSRVADGSVNAAAKLLSVRSGVDGTEVEYASIDKTGFSLPADNWRMDYSAGGASTQLTVKSGSTTYWSWDKGSGAAWARYSLKVFNSVASTELIRLSSADGQIMQIGTDSSASPGAATVNKPIGKAAIAIGASSVVVTNSLVAATSHVMITPHARDATCKELIVVPGSGSFTVSGLANATAALPFSWEIKTLL